MSVIGKRMKTAMRDLAERLDVEFFDLRDILPEGPGKFGGRKTNRIIGTCYHHQAIRPRPRAPSTTISHQLDQDGLARVKAGGGMWLDAIWRIARYHTGPDSHLKEGGAPGLSYSVAIDPDGGIHMLHDPEVKTWSQGTTKIRGDENEAWLGVLFMGNMRSKVHPEGSPPSPAQLAVAAMLWPTLKAGAFTEWDPQNATTHQSLGGKGCPGDDLVRVVDSIRTLQPEAPPDTFHLDSWLGRQRALNTVLGTDLKEDGIYGSSTKGAIVRFQRQAHIPADGIWGPTTERHMREALKKA